KYNDPSGKWPNWSNIGKAISKSFQTAVNVVKENMGVVHTVLDVAGMIPGVGEAFDAVNGVIYAAEGDFTNAGLSFSSCIPVIGNAIGGVKLATAGIGVIATVAKGIDRATNTHDVYRSIDKASGLVDYIGMTTDFPRRVGEQLKKAGRNIEKIPGLTNLSRIDARAVEQALIEYHGLSKNGGTLTNKINSIAATNPIYDQSIKRGWDLL
ncbi:MAG: hypothetical protein JXA46_07420, partial [Dehalococcoidales bacterium]|nr:hypothetical protein [Dehalococcoidales bacterium]